MSEEHYYWVELFLEECNIELSEYEGNRNLLNRKILESYFGNFMYLVDKSQDIAALQTLVVLILQVGARLPNDLKKRVLKSLNWINDNDRYHWSPYVINIRKIYLEDFKNKILNHKTGLKTFLINLRISQDKDLEHTSIGIEQLNSLVKEEMFDHVNYINLDSCGLLSIPEVLTKFPNLATLNLDNNYITSFPDFMDNLSNLKKLYLMNNKITHISSNFCKLGNLENVYLSYNQIKTLPLSLKYLKNLRSIYLNNNKIEIVPDIFDNLKKLSQFDLRSNPVMCIPSSLKESCKYKGTYSSEAFLSSLDKFHKN